MERRWAVKADMTGIGTKWQMVLMLEVGDSEDSLVFFMIAEQMKDYLDLYPKIIM